MVWLLPRAQFKRQKGEQNRQALKQIVDSGRAPGILAYAGAEPVGWCALAPREVYPTLGRSRVLAPVDDKPVWSIVCLFVAKPFRNKGVSKALLEAAVKYAREQGARIVEGYPFEPKTRLPDPFVWTGLTSAFIRAGFKEVLRRSKSRPIMRRRLRGSQPSAAGADQFSVERPKLRVTNRSV
jgi:GNAT superfamily N-acetyltransferase